MAVLTTLEKKDVAREWFKEVFEKPLKVANLNLDDLNDVIQTTEDWIESNQASFVVTLPEPFKSNTNSAEKTLLFVYVAMKRAGLI